MSFKNPSKAYRFDRSSWMPQLDGMRALAIFGVFIAHFLNPFVDFKIPIGSFGVRLFFVLSGFLITGILLKVRLEMGKSNLGFGRALKNFYIRRSLRIVVIFWLWILLVNRGNLGWRQIFEILYLSNFYDIFTNGGHGNHYWSLAVEEQFYLFWPLIVLLAPLRKLLPVFWTVVLFGVVGRVLLANFGFEYWIVKKLPFTCFDAMALGGIMAIMRGGGLQGSSDYRMANLRNISLTVGMVLLTVAIFALHYEGKGILYTSVAHTSFELLSVALLIPAVKGYGGAFGKFLELPAVRYVGTVSYGCYLFHMEAARLAMKALRYSGVESLPLIVEFGVKVAATIILAAASWEFLEKPINRLKSRFPMT